MNAALRPDFARTHAFLGRKHGLLINNEWVEPRAGGRIEVLNPATGKVLGHAAAGGACAPVVEARRPHRTGRR